MPCAFSRGLNDKNPVEHESVSFEVTLTKPNHTVKWYLNGVEITESIKFKPKNIDPLKFSLEIGDVLLSDEGPLKCAIFNENGEQIAASECKLAVKGKINKKFECVIIRFIKKFNFFKKYLSE